MLTCTCTLRCKNAMRMGIGWSAYIPIFRLFSFRFEQPKSIDERIIGLAGKPFPEHAVLSKQLFMCLLVRFHFACHVFIECFKVRLAYVTTTIQDFGYMLRNIMYWSCVYHAVHGCVRNYFPESWRTRYSIANFPRHLILVLCAQMQTLMLHPSLQSR